MSNTNQSAAGGPEVQARELVGSPPKVVTPARSLRARLVTDQWNRYKRWRERSPRRPMRDAATYLLPPALLGSLYWYGPDLLRLLHPNVQRYLYSHRRLIVLSMLVCIYLLGLIVREVLRYHFRMFAAPIICNAVMLFVLAVIIVSPDGTGWVNRGIDIVEKNPWTLILGFVLYWWGPQLNRMIPRLQKAELPGGTKFEIDKLDELQQTLNPWKKTVSRFADLMEWVAQLITETPDDEVIRFLAYTPALGYLTRTEKEWRRLHKLLIEKDNIQIICLEPKDLFDWHKKFEDKQTARPGGLIDKKLIEKANEISRGILEEKGRHLNPCMRPVVKSWEDMPGYYIFANSKRAIIVAPLFLPGDPKKQTTGDYTNNSNIRDTPVKMLGFESTDNWTVWLVNQVCDQYAPRVPVSHVSMPAA